MQGRSQQLQRSLPLALTLGVLAALLPALCLAQPLTAESVEGSAQYRGSAEADWQPLKADTVLTLPLEVKTGKNGHASLSQQGISVQLKPLTQLSLSGTEGDANGLISNIRQRLGTVFYRIEPHSGDLRVETPFLRAIVDGTEFIVVSTASDSFVTLTEGQLDVGVRGTQESRSLAPGEVARVSNSQTGIHAFNDAPMRSSSGAPDDSALHSGAVESESATADGFEIILAQINEMAATQAGQAAGPEEPAAGEDDGEFIQDPAPEGPDDVDGGLGNDDMPTDDPGPGGDDLPSDDPAPGGDDLPNDDPGPGGDDLPNDDPGPGGDDLPNDDPGPGGDDLPNDNPGPGGDDLPNDDPGPGGDDLPNDDLVPGGDDLLSDDPGPSGDDLPSDDEGHGGDERDNKNCHIIFCHDHPGGWGKGNGEGKGHNKGD